MPPKRKQPKNQPRLNVAEPEIPGLFETYLPDELALIILGYLNPIELSQAAVVSSEWRRLSGDSVLWKKLIETKMHPTIVNEVSNFIYGYKNEGEEEIKEDEKDYKLIYRKVKELEKITDHYSGVRMFETLSIIHSILAVINERIKKTKKNNQLSALKFYERNDQISSLLIQAQMERYFSDDSRMIRLGRKLSKIIGMPDDQMLFNLMLNAFIFIKDLKGSHTDSFSKLDHKLPSIQRRSTVTTQTFFKETQRAMEGYKKENEQLLTGCVSPKGNKPVSETTIHYLCISEYLSNQLFARSSQILLSLSNMITSQGNQFTSLDFKNITMDAGFIEALTNSLKNPNCKLVSLNLIEANIVEADENRVFQMIADALENETCNLLALSLCLNGSGGNKIDALSNALANKNCKLISLYLYFKDILPEELQALSLALVNSHLTSIHLTFNSSMHYDNTLLTSLSNALKDNNCQLRSLILSEVVNQMLSPIFEALIHEDCKLASLSINYVGGLDIADVLLIGNSITNQQCKLKSLNLNFNFILDIISEEVKQQLAETVVTAKYECKRSVNVLGIHKFDHYLQQAEENYQISHVQQEDVVGLRPGF